MTRYHVVLLTYSLFHFSSAMATEPNATAWVPVKVIQENTEVYRQPNRSSEVIGHYTLGTQLSVYSKIKDAFYLIHFADKFERTEFAWVHTKDVELLAPDPAEKPYGEDKSTYRWKHRLKFGGSFNQYAPSDFQKNFETTIGTFNGLSYHLEYERHFSSTSPLAFYAALQHYAFTQAAPGPTVSQQGSYILSGNAALLGLSLSFYTGKNFRLAMTVGSGIALNSEQSTSASASLSTSTLLGYPIVGQMSGEYGFSHGFEGYLKVGYQIETLNAVPVVPLSSVTQEVVQSTFSLSSPFVGCGIGWVF